MDDTGQLEENLHLQRRHLAHDLRRVEQLILCYWLQPITIRGVQVEPLHQLHVIEQRVEGHEIRVANLVPLCYLKSNQNNKQLSVSFPFLSSFSSSTHRHEIVPDLRRHQVVLHFDHHVLKVQRCDVATAARIFTLERLRGVLLVKVVQKLAKFHIVDRPLLLPPKVALHEAAVQLQRELGKQIRSLDHGHKVIWNEIIFNSVTSNHTERR